MFCLNSKVIEKYRKSGNILLVENGHGVRNILVFHKELYRSERSLSTPDIAPQIMFLWHSRSYP